MVAVALTVIVIIALITFMVWGDEGPLWQNWLTQLGLITVLVAGGALIVWVGTYGN